MTRKDYKLIAADLRSAYMGCDSPEQRGAVLASMTAISYRLLADNPRFDAGKFAAAVIKGEGL